MNEQNNGQDDLVLDLREDSPDWDKCARCRSPRVVHPLNLPDEREPIKHFFTLEVDLALETQTH